MTGEGRTAARLARLLAAAGYTAVWAHCRPCRRTFQIGCLVPCPVEVFLAASAQKACEGVQTALASSASIVVESFSSVGILPAD